MLFKVSTTAHVEKVFKDTYLIVKSWFLECMHFKLQWILPNQSPMCLYQYIHKEKVRELLKQSIIGSFIVLVKYFGLVSNINADKLYCYKYFDSQCKC